MQSWDDEDAYFLESVESLKQASASLELHESASCAALLPCGLLPEELEELEELEGGLLKASVTVEGALKSISISSGPAADVPAPLTPQGLPSPSAAGILSDAEDEEGEAAEEDGSEAIEAAPTPATEPAAVAPSAG